MVDARLEQRGICILAMQARKAGNLTARKKKPYRKIAKIVVAFQLWVIIMKKLFGGVVGRGRSRARINPIERNLVVQY